MLCAFRTLEALHCMDATQHALLPTLFVTLSIIPYTPCSPSLNLGCCVDKQREGSGSSEEQEEVSDLRALVKRAAGGDHAQVHIFTLLITTQYLLFCTVVVVHTSKKQP